MRRALIIATLTIAPVVAQAQALAIATTSPTQAAPAAKATPHNGFGAMMAELTRAAREQKAAQAASPATPAPPVVAAQSAMPAHAVAPTNAVLADAGGR